MMNTLLKLICAFLFVVSASGCVTVLDKVNNEPIQPDPGKRTFGTYMDDERLETILAVNLKKTNPELANAHLNVEAYNGVVLLTGEVPSKELKQAAGEIARDVSAVRQVHNEVLVRPNSTVFSRSNDAWLSTKVRTKLLANRNIESERVKIVVENRIVYLMGMLTRGEADLASEVAASVSGVDKVVRVIEYIGR